MDLAFLGFCFFLQWWGPLAAAGGPPVKSAPPPAPQHFRRLNTVPQSPSSACAVLIHRAASPESVRQKHQSDAPAPPRRHSHSLSQDSAATAESRQSPPPQMLRSVPPGPHPDRDPNPFSRAVFL